MDEKKLAALLAAVRTGSFSKAAEELGYTQSGLTQMMNSLENDLGCSLLVRSFSGVRPTGTGARLLPLIEEAAEALRRVRAEAEQLGAAGKSTLRIGTFPSISKAWLPQVIKGFKAVYPDIPIDIRVGGYDMGQWLAAGTVDLVLADENQRGAWKWIPLREDRFLAVVPGDCRLCGQSSVTIQQLFEYPFILTPVNELTPAADLWQEGRKHEMIHMNAIDDTSLLSLIEQGLGVTILPETSIRGHSGLVRVLALEPPIKRTLGMIMPKSPGKAASLFVSFMKSMA